MVLLEHAQRTGDFVEQARDFTEFCVFPAGFHEGNERLARIAEIGDGFAHHHVDDLQAFARGEILFAAGIVTAKARNLVVERGIDIQQRAGDIEQRAFVRGATAGNNLAHRIALLDNDVAGNAQPHHAQRVADAGQRIDLRTQFVGIGLLGAEVQVQ